MNSHGGQEEFLLKWNDHHNSFFAIMQDLVTNENLTDVTLACGGHIFETHKLMLCVCSTFFRQLLTRRPDRHPIVYLKDVNPNHLELLLQYMYNGEINVRQEDLGPLIETARSLQVKGLADGPTDNKRPAAQPSAISGPPPLKKARPPAGASQASRPSPLTTSHLANRLTQPRPVQHLAAKAAAVAAAAVAAASLKDDISAEGEDNDSQEGVWTGQTPESQADADASVDSEEYRIYPDTDMAAEDDGYSQDQVFPAAGAVTADGFVGGSSSSSKNLLMLSGGLKAAGNGGGGANGPSRRHTCDQCGKAFVTPSKLQRHVLSHSGIRPFHCQLCGRHFSQAANLKTHIRNTHADEDPSVLAMLAASIPPSIAAAAAAVAAAANRADPSSFSDNPIDDDISSDL